MEAATEADHSLRVSMSLSHKIKKHSLEDNQKQTPKLAVCDKKQIPFMSWSPHCTVLGIALNIVGAWCFLLQHPFDDGLKLSHMLSFLGSSPSRSVFNVAELDALQCRPNYQHPTGAPLPFLSVSSHLFDVGSFQYYHWLPDDILVSWAICPYVS